LPKNAEEKGKTMGKRIGESLGSAKKEKCTWAVRGARHWAPRVHDAQEGIGRGRKPNMLSDQLGEEKKVAGRVAYGPTAQKYARKAKKKRSKKEGEKEKKCAPRKVRSEKV